MKKLKRLCYKYIPPDKLKTSPEIPDAIRDFLVALNQNGLETNASGYPDIYVSFVRKLNPQEKQLVKSLAIQNKINGLIRWELVKAIKISQENDIDYVEIVNGKSNTARFLTKKSFIDARERIIASIGCFNKYNKCLKHFNIEPIMIFKEKN